MSLDPTFVLKIQKLFQKMYSEKCTLPLTQIQNLDTQV